MGTNLLVKPEILLFWCVTFMRMNFCSIVTSVPFNFYSHRTRSFRSFSAFSTRFSSH
nr:MAG TPA: hypothetical protein [Caudoviricetes sp.]